MAIVAIHIRRKKFLISSVLSSATTIIPVTRLTTDFMGFSVACQAYKRSLAI
ncbi:MAG: hypothetical protein HOF66_04640 [Nitrosomonadaceae bacterium]|nr:hypothetical protein [Nitrosomonadaceae bacterium]